MYKMDEMKEEIFQIIENVADDGDLWLMNQILKFMKNVTRPD